MSPFCNTRWLTGLIVLTLCGLGQVLVLPFVDVTLLSTTLVAAIVFNQIFSITILKEKATPKYDVPADLLIIGGCLMVALLSNYEEVSYSSERVKGLLKAPISIFLYFLFVASWTLSVLGNRYLRQLFRNFNKDANSYIAALIS